MKPEKIERRRSNEERLGLLRDHFPEVFADGQVNVERLREVLEDSASKVPDTEHYGLRWPGKEQARRLANQSPHATLRPVPKAGIDESTTDNMVIVGDNLQVLLALQKSYANSIKLIYIDPPYNTGNDFIYEDNFAIDEELYLQETRQADLNGRLVSNPQTGGRFHSNWLNFMYPRLRAAIALLADDGFLAISISDVELANLRLVLDEIMGPDTFVECFVWESIFRPSNMSKRTRKNAEYVLLYVKNSLTAFELIERLQDPQGDASLTQNNNAARTLRFPPSSLDCSIPDGTYTATDTADLEILEPLIVRGGKNASSFVVEGKLKWSQSYLDAEIAKGVTLKIKSTSLIPYYRKDYQQTALRPKKLIPNDLVADVLAANAEQAKLFDKQVFDYPKPTSLIEYFINSLPLAPDATILDFFAGSGTTGHAVWKSNAASGAKRRLVLIQLDAEVDMGTTTGQNALSLGLDTLDKITCERLRRASKAMKAAGATGDLGFRVFKEDSPALVRPLHLAQQQLQKGNLELFNEKRALIQPAALFAEVLLLLGFPLDSKREQVPQDSANTLWRFEHPRVPQPLLLCLDQKIDDNLLDALKDQRKHTFVCRDEALTDVAKARFYDALKRIDSTFKVL